MADHVATQRVFVALASGSRATGSATARAFHTAASLRTFTQASTWRD